MIIRCIELQLNKTKCQQGTFQKASKSDKQDFFATAPLITLLLKAYDKKNGIIDESHKQEWDKYVLSDVNQIRMRP